MEASGRPSREKYVSLSLLLVPAEPQTFDLYRSAKSSRLEQRLLFARRPHSLDNEVLQNLLPSAAFCSFIRPSEFAGHTAKLGLCRDHCRFVSHEALISACVSGF
jgi:hypothetical protein